MIPNCARLNVAVGFLHQFPHEIFDVAADITRLAEFRRVRFHKRNFDQLRDVFDQIGFTDAGRADQDHILLRVFGFLRAIRVFALEPPQIIDVIVMIANCDREDLLRFVLLDNESVEMRLDIAREKIESETRRRADSAAQRRRRSRRAPAARKLAKETLSPKFDFMNSESFDCSSSGDGKGGF